MKGRLGLVGRYAVESLILTTMMALILGGAVSWRATSAVVGAAGRATALTVNSFVSHELKGIDLSSSLSEAEITGFDTAISDNLLVSGIEAVKVWAPDGTLRYSSDGEDLGIAFPDDDELHRALAGETVTEVVTEPSGENTKQYASIGEMLETYSPLYVAGSEEPVGVFEVYESYAAVRSELRELNLLIWGVVALGAIILYFTQLQLVTQAERRLRAAEDETRAMNARLHDSMRNLEEHSVGTLQALLSAVDAKDSYTARHSLSVTDYALAIGRRLDLDPDDLLLLEQVGLLHDIGKIGVSESILLKPSRLTEEERAAIEEHSDIGARILESIPFLRELTPVVRYHHERWDGGGYPDGLRGEGIPRLARVLAVADAFDAMMSDRPYRTAMRLRDARSEIARNKGTQFDPECVDALERALDGGELWGSQAMARSQSSVTAST